MHSRCLWALARKVGENDSAAAQPSADAGAMQPALEPGSAQDWRRSGARRPELLPRDGSGNFKLELLPRGMSALGWRRASCAAASTCAGTTGLAFVVCALSDVFFNDSVETNSHQGLRGPQNI